MPVCFIFHGAYGSPEENWIPWLKHWLEKSGQKVYAPLFPTPRGQYLSNWMSVFDSYEKFVDSETVFVGHSVGATFILSVLEMAETKIRAAFLVSGFAGPLGNEKFDKLNKSFAEKSFDWERIRDSCRKFVIFHSDNDPHVPLEKAEFLKKKLRGELVLIKGGGHFNRQSGYTKFPELANQIKLLFQ